VWLLKDDIEIQVDFETIQAGDTVIVNAGEIIPVDGVIQSGSASVDQHLLTGESQPVEKENGDKVFAATLLLSGRIALWSGFGINMMALGPLSSILTYKSFPITAS